MSKPWVKLHTSMLGHAATILLPDRAFRLWIILLLMAGLTDDDGRVGTIEEIAVSMRSDQSEVLALLSTLNGRAASVDGTVYVRDWSEWQTRIDTTNAARQARYRAAHRNDEERNTPVTALRNDAEEKRREENTTAPIGAWVDVENAIGTAYGGASTRTANGKVRAWVGQVLGVAGRYTDDDPSAALALWRAWLDTITDAKYQPGKAKAAERFGAWCEKGGAAPLADWNRQY